MQCPKCNTALVTNARFCPVCGTSLPGSDASIPVPPGLDPEVSISQTSTVALDHEQNLPLSSTKGARFSPDAAPPMADSAHPTQFPPPQHQSMPWSATTQSTPPPQFSQQQAAGFRPQQT